MLDRLNAATRNRACASCTTRRKHSSCILYTYERAHRKRPILCIALLRHFLRLRLRARKTCARGIIASTTGRMGFNRAQDSRYSRISAIRADTSRRYFASALVLGYNFPRFSFDHNLHHKFVPQKPTAIIIPMTLPSRNHYC